MATPSSPTSFQVLFLQGSGSYEESLPIKEFYSREQLIGRPPTLVLTENLPLRLHFIAQDKNTRMYMDGLESISQALLEEDSAGRPFLGPGRLNLFSYGNYNWIPGLYWIEVRQEQQSYFAQIQVQPKEMTVAEWILMRDELEQELHGLALDLARRHLGFQHHLSDRLPPALLHHFLVVQRLFPQVMAALTDLQTKVNHRVRKEILSKSKTTARHHLLSARATRNLIRLSPPTALDFDLPENRWVKRIVKAVSVHLREFLAAVHSFELVLQTELTEQERYLWQKNTRLLQQERWRLHQTLRTYQQAATKMLRGLGLIRHADWYAQIGESTWGRLPQALQTDGRYHSLYLLHRLLEQADWQPLIDQSYHYQWKRTDRLYEIWCVIQICRALTAIGLMPISGWLYDQDFLQTQFLVPDLRPGTCLLFQKGELVVQVSVDQEIPRQSSATHLSGQPVYTQDVHNRPDLRLDLFRADAFLGCLVIDCKYRPLRGFWKEETLISGYDRPKAMSQLISYGMAIRSPYLHSQAPNWSETPSPAVLEVWAVYPGTEEQPEDAYVPDYGVRILGLRPGVGIHLLTEQLSAVISRANLAAGDGPQTAKLGGNE